MTMYPYHFDFKGLMLFGYARKSTTQDERQMASISSQEKFIFGQQPNGNRYDVSPDRYFKEQRSAKQKGNRKDFYDLLATIRQATKAGKRCGIVSWDLSRLSRNPSDSAEIIEMMYEERVLECIFTIGRVFTHLEDPDALYAEFGRHHAYSHKLSRDVKRGLNDKVERGWYPSPILPTGYKHNPILHSPTFRLGIDSEIIPDQPIFNQLIRLDKDMLTGKYNVEEITRLAKKRGLVNPKTKEPYSSKFFHDFFTNLFYHEGFTWNGQYHKDAKHEKLRTEEEYDRIQLLLTSRSRKTNKTKDKRYNYPYNAIFQCKCGAGMTTDHKQQVICTGCKKRGQKFKFSIKTKVACPRCSAKVTAMKSPSIIDQQYLRCNSKKCPHGRPSICVDDLESQVEKVLRSIEIKKEFATLMRKQLQVAHERESSGHKNVIHSLRNRLVQLEDEVSELVGLKIARKVNDKHFAVHSARLEKDIKDQKNKIKKAEQSVSDWHERVLLLLNFGERAAEAWRKDKAFRRSLLLLFGTRIQIANKQIHIDLPETLFVLHKFDKDFNSEPERPEPKKSPYSTRLIGATSKNSSKSRKPRPEPKMGLENMGFEANSKLSYLLRRAVRTARTLIITEYDHDVFLENLEKSEQFGFACCPSSLEAYEFFTQAKKKAREESS